MDTCQTRLVYIIQYHVYHFFTTHGSKGAASHIDLIKMLYVVAADTIPNEHERHGFAGMDQAPATRR